jgi:AcrR family transcriptional regulator
LLEFPRAPHKTDRSVRFCQENESKVNRRPKIKSAAASGRKKGQAQDKVLRTAVRLFYRQGYPNTGVNQIIEESGVAKSTFYQWYPSKDDLAMAYLNHYGQMLTSRLSRLLDRSKSVREFYFRWGRILRRDVIAFGEYHGCPFLNFAAQIHPGNPKLDQIPGQTMAHWIDMVDERLKRAVSDGELSADLDTALLARRVIHAFSGAQAMWRLTHDPACILDLESVLVQMTFGVES